MTARNKMLTAFLPKTVRHLSLYSSPGKLCEIESDNDGNDDDDDLGGEQDSEVSIRDRSHSLPSPCARTLRHFRLLRHRNTFIRSEST